MKSGALVFGVVVFVSLALGLTIVSFNDNGEPSKDSAIGGIMQLFNLTTSSIVNRLFFFMALIAVAILLGVIALIILSKIYNQRFKEEIERTKNQKI
jgi:hypothetical protein